MTERATLIVLAKAPLIGHGKTRLARDIGAVEALRRNRAMQAHTLRQAQNGHWSVILAVSPDRAITGRHSAWPAHVPRIAQGRGDLGARLRRLVRGRRKVMLIGVDCPMVSRAVLAQAWALLRRAPVVIGPALDGGFWCLAARRGEAVWSALQNVRWSSAHTRADLELAIESAIAHAPELIDIDDRASLKALSDQARDKAAQRHSRG
jgi:glycosyltransferase A (GT-A) superfamily protein (DUF2064 family)